MKEQVRKKEMERRKEKEREEGGGERKRARISGKINELNFRRSDGWMVQVGNRKI